MLEFDGSDTLASYKSYERYEKYIESHDGKSMVMTKSQWDDNERMKFQAVEAKWADKEYVNTWRNSMAIDKIIKKLDDISNKLDSINK